jgi:TolB-like protein/DNA-binding winged helix-turn-helix (wHTH) protein/cytochrome c-type biogenesis protein CcmH/NrfG
VAEIQGDSFRLGDWLVDPARGRVSHGEVTASLRPREMDLLLYLAERHGEVVPTDDIMRDVWAGVEVTNDSLYYSISQLRKVLDEHAAGPSVIETIPKRGYRVTVPVGPPGAPPAGDTTPAAAAGSDGVRVRLRPSRQHVFSIAAAIVVALLAMFWHTTTDDDGAPAPELRSGLADGGSIAVMPFIDLTPEADYTYFSDGITEEILNQLTRVPGLRVAARTSSFTFKDSDADVVEIGRSLGVGHLLEGSVRKEGDRVRIAVQLIDAATGFQRWSDSYDRELTSVFQVQNEISRRVADALELTLVTASEAAAAEQRQPASPAALDEYLLGLEALRVSSFDTLRAAQGHFENVLELDPGFDNARVQLAATKLQLLNTGATADRTLVDDADRLVSTVLDRHPDDADAHRVSGIVRKWQGRWPEARAQFERALQIAPSDSESLVQLAEAFASSGDIPEARRLLDRAVRIDPFSVRILHTYAYVQRQLGEIDVALQAMTRAVDLHPDNPNPRWMLGQIQAAEFGQLAAGLGNFLASAERDPSDYEIAAYVAAAYLSLDMPESALPWIEQAERIGPEGAVTTRAVRAIYAMINGDHRDAGDIALTGLRERGYRYMAHSLLTKAMLNLVASESSRQGQASEAAEFLDEQAPDPVEYAGKFLGEDVDFQGLMAMSDLPRRWYVALAIAATESGDQSLRARALDQLASTRIDAVREIRNSLLNDDYLVEAEVRAIEGDVEGAFAMLSEAVDGNLLFLWQVHYENNVAFAALHDDPRWIELMDRIRAKVTAERQEVLTTVGRLDIADTR